jgi:hypothetical protein
MLPRRSSNLFQITNPGAFAHHAKIQPAAIEKLRTKRITCSTYEGKGCAGRCRFRKSHD